MKKIALAALLATAFTASHAAVITFEGLASSDTLIPNGYAGLDWSNFATLDASSPANSGYPNALLSGKNVAFNANGAPATISGSGFSLYDGYFTAAWNDGLQIRADAVFEGGDTSSITFTANTAGPVDEIFGWTGLASVTFTSFGGTAHSGFGGSGVHFALDDLSTTAPVPEASNLALMIAGLGFVGFAARRRKA